MEFNGCLTGLSRDWNTDLVQISFSIDDESVLKEIEKLKNSKLSIQVKKYRKKRSLDANAYLWVLCSKLAIVHETSKDEIYEEMLQKYGELYQDDEGNYIIITLRADIDTSKIDGHWKYYKSSADGKFKSYLMIKGTSQYDSLEMSRFVDMVVQEAKDDGIDVLPPDELERIKALWGVKNG